ncbi:MAG TPA: M48 family metalloprotease [Verrucomicrobiota bacterium]|nr:M48 family metalloprotease [Verrucomicrobiota bacterium]HNU52220.1 M48 family metalloprotease [Verrucomicrobiota bacterium]
MSRDEFDRLVRRLEERAEARPKRYAMRVAALAALGYGYIGLVLVLLLTVTAAMVGMIVAAPSVLTIKAGLVLGAITGGLSWAILKGLWVRLPAPAGCRVTRAEVPALFNLIDEVRGALRAPPVHGVLVDGRFNAGVTQVPRLGVFGWQKNYLILGLPLLLGLTAEEFKAVLAHEFGHLSGNHARFSGWVYRLRQTWERVFAEIARQRQRGAFLLTKFLAWYWPRFNAHAFVLGRQNEYVADACAAQLAGPESAARALVRTVVLDGHLDHQFWPELYRRTGVETSPPADVFGALARAVRAVPAAGDGARWLRAAFNLRTTTQDTHPCLTDRLRALGQWPAGSGPDPVLEALPPNDGPSAADEYLGSALPELAGRLGREWAGAVADRWRQRHAEVEQLRQELAALEASAAGPLTIERLWHKATLLVQLDGDAAALPVVNQVLSQDPGHAEANFVRGRHDLEQDDPGGVAFVERAMTRDVESIPHGCQLLYGFYARTGRREALRDIETRMDAHAELMQQAAAERADVTAKDLLWPHNLTAEVLPALRDVFAAEPDIDVVYAARKAVRHFPDQPFTVFALGLRVPWWKPRSTSASQRLVERVLEKIELPGRILVFVTEGNLKRLGRRVAGMPGARVYGRSAAWPQPKPSGSALAPGSDDPAGRRAAKALSRTT